MALPSRVRRRPGRPSAHGILGVALALSAATACAILAVKGTAKSAFVVGGHLTGRGGRGRQRLISARAVEDEDSDWMRAFRDVLGGSEGKLYDRLQEEKARSATLTEEVTEKREALKQAKQRAMDMELAAQNLRTRAANLESDLKRERADADRAKTRQKELSMQATQELRSKAASLEAELMMQRAALNAADTGDFEKAVAEATKKLRNKTFSLEAELKQEREEKAELEQKAKAAGEQATAAGERATAADERAEARVREAEAKAEAMQQKADEAAKAVEALQAKTAELESQVEGSAEVRQEREELLAKTSQLEAELVSERERLAAAERRAEEAEQLAAEIQKELEQAEARALKAELEGLEKIQTLEAEMEKTEAVVDGLKKDLAGERQVSAGLRQQIKALQEAYAELGDKLESSQLCQEEIKAEQQRLSKELEETAGQMALLVTQMEAKTKELEEAQEQLRSVRRSMKAALGNLVTKATSKVGESGLGSFFSQVKARAGKLGEGAKLRVGQFKLKVGGMRGKGS